VNVKSLSVQLLVTPWTAACQAIVREMVGWHHQLDGHQFE